MMLPQSPVLGEVMPRAQLLGPGDLRGFGLGCARLYPPGKQTAERPPPTPSSPLAS